MKGVKQRCGREIGAVPPAHHRPGGGFRNPWRDFAPDIPQGFLAWARAHRTTNPRPLDPHPSVFPRASPASSSPRAHEAALTVTWVGHATFLIQIGGLNILTPFGQSNGNSGAWRIQIAGRSVSGHYS